MFSKGPTTAELVESWVSYYTPTGGTMLLFFLCQLSFNDVGDTKQLQSLWKLWRALFRHKGVAFFNLKIVSVFDGR